MKAAIRNQRSLVLWYLPVVSCVFWLCRLATVEPSDSLRRWTYKGSLALARFGQLQSQLLDKNAAQARLSAQMSACCEVYDGAVNGANNGLHALLMRVAVSLVATSIAVYCPLQSMARVAPSRQRAASLCLLSFYLCTYCSVPAVVVRTLHAQCLQATILGSR